MTKTELEFVAFLARCMLPPIAKAAKANLDEYEAGRLTGAAELVGIIIRGVTADAAEICRASGVDPDDPTDVAYHRNDSDAAAFVYAARSLAASIEAWGEDMDRVQLLHDFMLAGTTFFAGEKA